MTLLISSIGNSLKCSLCSSRFVHSKNDFSKFWDTTWDNWEANCFIRYFWSRPQELRPSLSKFSWVSQYSYKIYFMHISPQLLNFTWTYFGRYVFTNLYNSSLWEEKNSLTHQNDKKFLVKINLAFFSTKNKHCLKIYTYLLLSLPGASPRSTI